MLVLDGAETSGYRGVAGQWRLGVGLVVKGGGGRCLKRGTTGTSQRVRHWQLPHRNRLSVVR